MSLFLEHFNLRQRQQINKVHIGPEDILISAGRGQQPHVPQEGKAHLWGGVKQEKSTSRTRFTAGLRREMAA